MVVRRIVANIATGDPTMTLSFYRDLLGMEVAMDLGWILTYASGETAKAQVSVLSEGGSGTPVPALSIEVDDVDAVYRTARAAGFGIEYEITDEPWGVRRFFVLDPAGTLVNILSHQTRQAS